MKQRCFNSQHPQYEDYGGRGITVCVSWKDSFENFYADMGPRPSDEHSLDRYPNNDGNYEPGNCRWATDTEQKNNTRGNVVYEYRGENLTRAQLTQKYGITAAAVRSRLAKGEDLETALSRPVNNRTYTHDGQTLNLRQWAEKLGIKYSTLHARINRSDMSFEDAIKNATL